MEEQTQKDSDDRPEKGGSGGEEKFWKLAVPTKNRANGDKLFFGLCSQHNSSGRQANEIVSRGKHSNAYN